MKHPKKQVVAVQMNKHQLLNALRQMTIDRSSLEDVNDWSYFDADVLEQIAEYIRIQLDEEHERLEDSDEDEEELEDEENSNAAITYQVIPVPEHISEQINQIFKDRNGNEIRPWFQVSFWEYVLPKSWREPFYRWRQSKGWRW